MDVLIIDDSRTMLQHLQRTLEAEHGAAVVCHTDPTAALVEGRTHAFDLVLVDQNMPELDGITLVAEFRSLAHYAQVPIVIITADTCDKVRLAAFEAGATDLLAKRTKGVELSVRLRNLVRLATAVRRLDEQASALAFEVERAARRLYEREAEVIFRLALAVEYRDNDTGGHTWRVARYSQIIAETLGLDQDLCRNLYLAAPLHDVGKVAIPDDVLLKKGRLNDAEFLKIRSHPLVGKRILDGSASELIRLAAEIAEFHHERWDGGGYPHALAGIAIPLSARIVAVADVFDALTTERPYKAAMPFAEALHCIQAEKGKHFDPLCVDAFEMAWDKIRLVQNSRSSDRLAAIVRGVEPWARVPEMRREISSS